MINSAPRFKKDVIIEQHPDDYTGYPFVTLIQYKHTQSFISIIDNSDSKSIKAYILDLCKTEDVDEVKLIDVAVNWYSNNYYNRPLSIDLALNGMGNAVTKILKIYHIDCVTRIIGPVQHYPTSEVFFIKKRKKRTIPKTVAAIAQQITTSQCA